MPFEPSPTQTAHKAARRDQWQWSGSYGLSASVHIGLILLLGVLLVPPEPKSPGTSVNLGIVAEENEPPHKQAPFLTVDLPQGSAGRIVEPQKPRVPNTSKLKITAADEVPQLPPSLLALVPRPSETKKSGGNAAPGSGTGKGDGTGNGSGVDDTKGFFNGELKGGSFVFVVDCSRSMKHPHKSAAKTRFRRLKLELLKAVGLMKENQRFFIIFFNTEAIPMPAQAMQVGITPAKQKYLAWAMQIPAKGDTDPRKALSLALRLRPEVIYFLTDGDFKLGIQNGLLKLRQSNTIINTITLGNKDGAATMKKIAAQNGGKYTFVP